jgi:protein KRI1
MQRRKGKGFPRRKTYKQKNQSTQQFSEIQQEQTEEQPPNNNDSDSSSSGEEDDDAVLATSIAKEFIEILPKIAFKHKDITNPSKLFFPDETSPAVHNNIKKNNQEPETPLYYKDMVREEVLDIIEGNRPIEAEEEEEEKNDEENVPINELDLPIAVQEKLAREEFIKAVHNIDEKDDNLLTKKIKTQEEKDKEENEYLSFIKERKNRTDDTSQIIEKYWLSEDVDEDEKFLRNYVLKKGWINTHTDGQGYEDITEDIDNIDQGHLPEQAKFERKYNFRFQEPGSTVIPTYDRSMIETLRKPNNKRKEKRQKRQERKDKEKKKMMIMKKLRKTTNMN